jgi:hypothetical protein
MGPERDQRMRANPLRTSEFERSSSPRRRLACGVQSSDNGGGDLQKGSKNSVAAQYLG